MYGMTDIRNDSYTVRKETKMRSHIDQTTNQTPSTPKKTTPKQIAALAGVALLVLLYAATLVVAIFDSSASGHLFAVCIFATLAVPILLWIYIWLYGKMTGKHTLADPKDQEEAPERTNEDSITVSHRHQA